MSATISRGKVTRSDIEDKLRSVQAELGRVRARSQPNLLAVALVSAGVLAVVAYALGRRAGTRRSAVVEVRRL